MLVALVALAIFGYVHERAVQCDGGDWLSGLLDPAAGTRDAAALQSDLAHSKYFSAIRVLGVKGARAYVSRCCDLPIPRAVFRKYRSDFAAVAAEWSAVYARLHPLSLVKSTSFIEVGNDGSNAVESPWCQSP